LSLNGQAPWIPNERPPTKTGNYHDKISRYDLAGKLSFRPDAFYGNRSHRCTARVGLKFN
jgi:hypothetical protein